MKRILLAVLTCALAAAGLNGCTTVRHSFPGYEEGQVWTALKAVAHTPDYSDEDPTKRWFVKENHVMVFEEESRIEIYRKLDRILEVETVKPQREQRNWQFRVLLTGGDTPTATFVSRGIGVPMQAHAEAVRYFDDVMTLLAGVETMDLPPRATGEMTPVPETIEPGARPIVEIEDLEPIPPGG
jgi:hypothetical protein